MKTHWTGVARWLDQVQRESDTRGDPDLLEAFLRHGDAEAFARLVRRHGPMVHGVCRRVLGHAHDVEDAFQATFLVLLRKAASLQWQDRLGPWLHGVAYRTALKARGRRTRRLAVEQATHPMTPEPTTQDTRPLDELDQLDAALLALPERYRLPLVLCELQGMSRRAAARSLKLPEGTLSSRLARGRQLLRRRLTESGVTLSAAALLTLLALEAKAELPQRLIGTTVRTAAALQAGQNVTSSILALTEGVVKSMFLSKLKNVSVVVIALVLLGGLATGTLTMAWGQPMVRPPAPPLQPAPPPAAPPPAVVEPVEQFIIQMRVLQKEKHAEPQVVTQPRVITLPNQPASVLVGGEKAVEQGAGPTKSIRRIPFGSQLTVTVVRVDAQRVRLELHGAFDQPQEEEGYDYRIVGEHIRCMKIINLGKAEKLALRKAKDGSSE